MRAVNKLNFKGEKIISAKFRKTINVKEKEGKGANKTINSFVGLDA